MDLLKDRLGPIFRRYLLASFGGALISCIYNAVDVICVGQYEGPDGAAALACITPIWTIFFSLGLLFGIGGSVRMGLCRGEGRKADGDGYFTAALLLGLVASLVLTTAALVWRVPLLRFFGAEGAVLDCVAAYSAWNFPAIPIFLMQQLLLPFLRNDGAPLRCTAAVLGGGCLNIVLDLTFVFGLDLGAYGAGMATTIGQLLGLGIVLSYFLSPRCTLRLGRPRPFLSLAGRSVTAGVTPFLMELSSGISVFLFNRQIMRYGSSLELAVFGAVTGCALVFQGLFCGVGQTLQPIVSVNHGAGRHDRVRRTFVLALRATAVMGLVFLLLAELLPGALLRLYMDVTPAVLRVGPGILRVYALSFPLMGLNLVSGYYLQSMLRSGASLAVSLARGVVLTGPLLLLLPALWGADALWWTMPLAELGTLALAALLLRRGGKNSGEPLSFSPPL